MEHCDYKIRATVKKDFLDDVIQLFDIFRKQDVKVFARDGLLLGAMRHKGFLPFDVDPDVGILTENYSDLKNADLSDDYILNVGPTKRNVKYYFKTGIPYEFQISKSGHTKYVRTLIIILAFVGFVITLFKFFITRQLKYLLFDLVILGITFVLNWLVVPLFKGATILDGTIFPRKNANSYYQEVEKNEKDVFNKEYGHSNENVYKYDREDFFPLVEQPFYNGTIQVPNKAVKILLEHYGKDAMNIMYKKEDSVKEKIDISKCIPTPATII